MSDPDPAEHLTLRLGDVGVAGADHLVDARDRVRAVGQRRHRLRAADTVDLVHPGQGRGSQDQRVQHAVGRRHHHHQPAHARHLGRIAFISTELG
jgi:hypothetical protein